MLRCKSAWKVLWLLAVAAPTVAAGDDDELSRVIFSCALVVVVLAVLPRRYAWRQYVGTRAEPWRA